MGEAFKVDMEKVHTILVIFTSGNETVYSNMMIQAKQKHGFFWFLSLCYYFKRVRVLCIDINQDKQIL